MATTPLAMLAETAIAFFVLWLIGAVGLAAITHRDIRRNGIWLDPKAKSIAWGKWYEETFGLFVFFLFLTPVAAFVMRL